MPDFGVTEKKAEALSRRMAALDVREEDLQESFVLGGGKGGQKVNKTAAAVQLRHTPSGVEVKAHRERSQALNRYYARKRLCELLEEQRLGKKSPEALKAEKLRRQKQRRKRRTKKRLAPEKETATDADTRGRDDQVD
jgi:protein subunit release factor B